MDNNKNTNNSQPEIFLESERKQHIGILEELKEKIEKESWTNFVSKHKM